LVADLRLGQVKSLHDRLKETYSIDEDAARWAVSAKRTFNVIHFANAIKVDIYVVGDDSLSRAQIERRIFVEAVGKRLPICAPEDIVLQKLLWFERGARVSDRQWRDLLGVVRVNREALDREYLDRQAAANGLSELLARLLAEADPP